MARINALVNSFTSGELTPKMGARVDTTKYRSGLKTCKNFIVMPHGGVYKRGGTRFVAPCKEGATVNKLMEFQFNTEQAYMLEFGYAGAGYIRFFTNGGILTEDPIAIEGITQSNPCVVTATSHGLINGQWIVITGAGGMTELNNRHFQVSSATANTFALLGVNSTGYGAWTSGGSAARIYEIDTDYAEDEIADLSYAQSADTLYLAHSNHPLKKLTRLGAANWELSNVAIANGPFRRINADLDNTMSVSLTSMSGNITGATQANPVVITTSAAHGLVDGATVSIASVGGMTALNGNKYSIRVVSDTSFYLCDMRGVKIDGTGYGAYTSGGTWTSATSTFSTYSPGTKITLTAFNDTFTPDHIGAFWRLWEPGKSTGVGQPYSGRTVSNNSQYTKDAKVYGIYNLTGTSTWDEEWNYPTHDTGYVRVANEGATEYFDSVYLHDSTCIVKVTEYVSAKQVRAIIQRNHMPSSVINSGTAYWEEGAWSAHRGYPSLVTFHEQRLWAAGGVAEPQTIWASEAGLFEQFLDGADDDKALTYKIATDRVESPIWILPGKIMALGTASGEFSIMSNNQEAMTPSNVRVLRQTNMGSSMIGRAIRIGNSAMFIQRDGDPNVGGRRIREFSYQFDSDSFISADLIILSEHLGQSRFLDMVHVQSPNPLVWVQRENGTFIGLTYEREQEVLGWHQHALGGGGLIKNIGAAVGNDGDEFWMIVERNINGETVRHIEVLTTPDITTAAKANGVYLDSHLTYEGDATTTVYGLNHLEGETVQVLADGAVHPDVTVIGGSITLSSPASIIHVGYAYTSILETMDLEAGAQAGTAHGRPKRVSNCVVHFYRSLGGRLGTQNSMDEIYFRSTADSMDSSPPLFTGFKDVQFTGGWDQEAVVRIEHGQPLPMNVLSITVTMNATG